MNAVAGVGLRRAQARVLHFGHMVRFSHSVFALPFALAGVLLAAHSVGRVPGWETWLWVTAAMVGARSAAMAVNRIVDRRLDAANPRTAGRELPRGALTLRTAWFFTGASVLLFLVACWRIHPLALALAPAALLIIVFYSFTKRFTWASHLFLGLALAVAPVGGWVAVTGRLDPPPFLLALAVLTWVAGFDILYAFQDVDFDRAHGLHSVPARFGIPTALRAARVLHGLSVAALAAVGVVIPLSPWYGVGVGLVAVLLVLEHRLVRADDLSRLNRAFFDLNAGVSVLVLVATAAGVFL